MNTPDELSDTELWDDVDTDRIDLAAIRRLLGEDDIITEGREPAPRPLRLADRVPMVFGTLRPAPHRVAKPALVRATAGAFATSLFLLMTAGMLSVGVFTAW